MQMPVKEKCFDCDQPAEYVRCTQFAGDHYMCKKHAEKEKDFLIKGVWDKIDEKSS